MPVAHVQHGPKRSVDRNPYQEPTTENAKVRKAAFVLRGGSCSLKIHTLSLIETKRDSFTVRITNLNNFFTPHYIDIDGNVGYNMDG